MTLTVLSDMEEGMAADERGHLSDNRITEHDNKHGCHYMVHLHGRTQVINTLSYNMQESPVGYPQASREKSMKTISLEAPQAMLPSRSESAA
jgi:hypothetical protein